MQVGVDCRLCSDKKFWCFFWSSAACVKKMEYTLIKWGQQKQIKNQRAKYQVVNLLLQLVFEMHDGSNGGKRHLSELKKNKSSLLIVSISGSG